MLIRMLVMANSAKNRGRCLAGLNVETGKWVRPVPNTLSRAIDNELTIFSERFIRPGDLVDVEIGSPIPLPYHPEDVELTGRIKLVGKEVTHFMSDLVSSELSLPNQLLESTVDRISIEQVRVSPVRNSLALALASQVKFFVNERGSRRVRFLANDSYWSLASTDDKLESTESLDKSLICISLAEPWEFTESHHKLAAGFIPFDESQPEFNSLLKERIIEVPVNGNHVALNTAQVDRLSKDSEPRVGRKVHTQKYGIGVITLVGEFYLEINFYDMGNEFLSRDDLNLDYLD